MKKLKIYKGEFEGVCPVGNCLVLAAYDKKQAMKMAKECIEHTTEIKITEVVLSEPTIIEYLSGDY